jgi:CubicO group peptidase (beta-lactamase class C family)
VQAATGQRLSEMARARLFAPLGITGERWDAHRDGTTYGGVRLYLTARDMARLGELCLQGGAWNGRQIVPAAWIAAATAPHSTSPEGPYGYHWWVRPLGYTAQGFGGQYIFVIPRHRLVVVMTADPDAGRHIGFGPMERLISETILRAIRPAPAR